MRIALPGKELIAQILERYVGYPVLERSLRLEVEQLDDRAEPNWTARLRSELSGNDRRYYLYALFGVRQHYDLLPID